MRSDIKGSWAMIQRLGPTPQRGDPVKVLGHDRRWRNARIHSIDPDLAELQNGNILELGPDTHVRFIVNGDAAHLDRGFSFPK